MGTYADCSIDLELARKGAPLITSGGTFIVRFAGRANPTYMKALEAKYRPYRRALAAGTLSWEIRDRLDRELFVETLLAGWKEDVTAPPDPETGEEKPLEFTRDNALKLFEDMPHLFEEAEFGSRQPEVFRSYEREEAAGN